MAIAFGSQFCIKDNVVAMIVRSARCAARGRIRCAQKFVSLRTCAPRIPCLRIRTSPGQHCGDVDNGQDFHSTECSGPSERHEVYWSRLFYTQGVTGELRARLNLSTGACWFKRPHGTEWRVLPNTDFWDPQAALLCFCL